ncbi:unnamed protein product, partial [Pleuronectes platessa]
RLLLSAGIESLPQLKKKKIIKNEDSHSTRELQTMKGVTSHPIASHSWVQDPPVPPLCFELSTHRCPFLNWHECGSQLQWLMSDVAESDVLARSAKNQDAAALTLPLARLWSLVYTGARTLRSNVSAQHTERLDNQDRNQIKDQFPQIKSKEKVKDLARKVPMPLRAPYKKFGLTSASRKGTSEQPMPQRPGKDGLGGVACVKVNRVEKRRILCTEPDEENS